MPRSMRFSGQPTVTAISRRPSMAGRSRTISSPPLYRLGVERMGPIRHHSPARPHGRTPTYSQVCPCAVATPVFVNNPPNKIALFPPLTAAIA